MKIAYIGSNDILAETLVERLVQEGHDVYLVSDKALPKRRSLSRHRFYRTPRKGETFQDLLQSIAPDCVVFAGNHYLDVAPLPGESDADVALLASTLRAAAALSGVKVVLLSSTDVYGDTEIAASEQTPCAPVSERGMQFAREEQLLDLYRQHPNMEATTLRASQLYGDRLTADGMDFLSRSFAAITLGKGRMGGGALNRSMLLTLPMPSSAY